MSATAVVATGHPEVSRAAAEVLRAGGNAFDAAVAAGCAGAVAEPALTSLGGGGFLLARTASGEARLFDFFVDTPGRGRAAAECEPHFLPITVRFPASEQVFNVGLGSVAVPGNVRGFLHVHRRLGRLPLAEGVAPAVALARDGVEQNAQQAYFLDLLTPIMALRPEGAALYAPGGRAPAAGTVLRNPELADFLEVWAREGDGVFYDGAVAQRICGDMDGGGGLLTREDLEAYRVIEREPLEQRYRGWRLLTNPPPAFGGTLVALSLALLEVVDFSALRFGSAEHVSHLLAVMREVDRRRDEALRGALLAADVEESRVRVRRALRGTTHVSVIDAEGNAASLTTSNGEGSGYLAPGTGIMLNNMLGEDDLHPDGFHASPAGLRVASMMAPSLLLDGNSLALAVGSGGSKRIRSALLQVISARADFGLSLRQAVDAPRVHWDGESLQVEPGMPDETLAALRALTPVNPWPVLDVYFGGVQAASPDGDGAGDPRRGGAAIALDATA